MVKVDLNQEVAMNNPLHTIGEVAERLAAADGVNSAPYFARQLRSMVQRRILEPVTYQGEGRTAAAIFNEEGICEARLLTALARLGFSPEQQLDAHHCMRNMSDDAFREEMAGKPFRPGLPAAIEGTKRGERWFLVLHMKQERFEHEGDAGISGSFTRKPSFDVLLIQNLSLASVVLDCSTLFRGLLEQESTTQV